LYVADLEQGLAFYRDRLGHALLWRTEEAAGLRLAEDRSEIVLHTERLPIEVDLKVESADAAAARFQEAGGEVVVQPFEIQIGRAAVVKDPWGNQLVLLDDSKGPLVTDAQGGVIGVGTPRAPEGYDELYEEALRLAARAHRDQERKGTDLPYIVHPVHVSGILRRHGFPGPVVTAALLHDVVEDQDIALEEIAARFGAQVAEIVEAMSERKLDGRGEKRPWQVRKTEAVDKLRRSSVAAVAVKAADVLHNVQSILYDLRHDGPNVWCRFTRGPEQMAWYYGQCAELAQARLGDHPLVRELLAALDGFKMAAERFRSGTGTLGER
jgi:predicted enzyme related to lactoylglutathione lyase